MARPILNYSHLQAQRHELDFQLCRLEALLEIGLQEGLAKVSSQGAHFYLRVLDDIAAKMRKTLA